MDPELLHYAQRARRAADRATRFCASAIKAAMAAKRWHARAETFAANAAYESAEANYAWERVRVQFRRLGIMIPEYGNTDDEADDDIDKIIINDDADDADDDAEAAADEEIRWLKNAETPGAEEGDGGTEDEVDWRGPDREPREAQQAGREPGDAQQVGRRVRARRSRD